MAIFRETMDKLGTAGELIGFLWAQKLWWLIPFVVVLVALGLLIVVGSSTGIGPFVYTLF